MATTMKISQLMIPQRAELLEKVKETIDKWFYCMTFEELDDIINLEHGFRFTPPVLSEFTKNIGLGKKSDMKNVTRKYTKKIFDERVVRSLFETVYDTCSYSGTREEVLTEFK